MQKIDFNKDWICRCLTRDEEAYPVTLPHDAMLSEPRTQESTGEGNIGWYIGGDYEYTKNFFVPEEYKGKKVLIEFEGKRRLTVLMVIPIFMWIQRAFSSMEKRMRSKSLRAMLTSQTAAGIQEQESTVRCTSGQVIRSTFR